MSADLKSPCGLRKLFLEWRARRLGDPVQRLAYLQRAAKVSHSKPRVHSSWFLMPVLLVLLFGATRVQTVSDVNAGLPAPAQQQIAATGREIAPTAGKLGPVWLVEAGPEFETYSNGLRIETQYCTANGRRSYVIFRDGFPRGWYDKPAGIVFHTSESVLAPFSSDQNDKLTRIGRELLEYVSRHKAYHFVIDRFGRVFRMVPETDSANHAGYSVWSDQNGVYVNLNHSFLGVSFEARTREIDEGPYLSPPQIQSGRLLVDMLVSKYQIPLENCVTHAQVSVDPMTMTIGHHYDGAGDFPFQQLGVPDNYGLPLPSLVLFGFDFDSRFLMYSGHRMWKGMRASEKLLLRDAESRNVPVDQYKQDLRRNYRASVEALKTLGIIKEN